jgi:PAS domain S-box-containing protein
MRAPLIVGLVAVLLFISVTTFLGFRQTAEFVEDERRIIHTHEVLSQISGTYARIREVESAVRGFALTEEEAFLESFPEHRSGILESVGRLQTLVRDNPRQLKRLDGLSSLLIERVERWELLIRKRRTDGVAAAGEQASLGRVVSGKIRGVLDEMEQEERGLLESRLAESEGSLNHTKVLFGTLAGASALIFVVLFFASSRLLEHRRLAERELDQFFTTTLDLMAIADLKSGKFTRMSPACERTLGWTVAEITSQAWLDFVHPDDRASTIAEAAKLAQGEPVLSFQNRYRCKDGTYRWIAWKVPAPFPGSTVLYAVGRDITEIKRTEEEIHRLNGDLARRIEEAVSANKELQAFSYSVSHDLRAPLRAIDGFSRILLEDHADRLDGEGKRLFNVVRSNTQQMGQLIDDLLQFSRLGRAEVEKTQVDMGTLARNAVEEVERLEPGRVVEVGVGGLPAVRGDRALLKQVWVNLVSNAFKYSRPKNPARIEIGASAKAGEVIFHIRDNGVGFDMQYVGKLFEVFQRLHTRTQFEGTGVGLAIVQRVVQRHGGRVWAESELGVGSTFYFAIPV